MALSRRTLDPIEMGLMFALGFFVSTSKAGIYLCTVLLAVFFASKVCIDSAYRRELFSNRLFQVSSAIYLFGVVATWFASGSTEDAAWLARKSLILWLLCPLLLSAARPRHFKVGLLGVVLGFWTAALLTLHQAGWAWNGERMPGATWPVDTWGVLCAMLTCLLAPIALWLRGSSVLRIGAGLAAVMAYLFLIMSGARGPLIGATLPLMVYLAVYSWRLLGAAVLGAALLVGATQLIWPQQLAAVGERVASIGDLSGNASNSIRLEVWRLGSLFVQGQALSGDARFWLGNGHYGKEEILGEFQIQVMSASETAWLVLREHNWRLNDLHSMYLESIAQNGVIWTVLVLFLIMQISLGPLFRRHRYTDLSVAAATVPLGLCFLLIGVTYSLMPHFALVFLVYFAALVRGGMVAFESRDQVTQRSSRG